MSALKTENTSLDFLNWIKNEFKIARHSYKISGSSKLVSLSSIFTVSNGIIVSISPLSK